jgi:hypothetical protein
MSTQNPPAAGPAQPTNSAPTIEPSVGEAHSHREALRTAADRVSDSTAGDLNDLARAFDAAASLAKLADNVNPEIELANQELALLAFAHLLTTHSLRRSGRDDVADTFEELATRTVSLVLEANES